MAKEIYLSVDGKQVALTDEQLKALGLYEEPKKNPFEIVEFENEFYYISVNDEVEIMIDQRGKFSNKMFLIANYCTDKELMQQRALHETLNRLLWRFSMENDGDKIDWNDTSKPKYYILFDEENKCFEIDFYRYSHCPMIYFYTKKIAQRAIDKIVKPFMEKHPDFIW